MIQFQSLAISFHRIKLLDWYTLICLNVIFVNWMAYQVGIVNDFPFPSRAFSLKLFHSK